MRTIYNSDQYELGGAERTRQRQVLVALFSRLGLKDIQIIERLQENGYIPITWEFRRKQLLVNRDVRKVKKEDLETYRRLMQEGNGALVEYIGRLSIALQKAYEDGDWRLYRDTAKDLARAHGVPTEEPIRIEGDILAQMQLAFRAGMKKISEQKSLPPPPPIEVSP